MPAKNSRKQYLENGYYHIYNRGVEKRKIYNEETDYRVFLSYLKEYLLPKDIPYIQSILSDRNTDLAQKDKAKRALKMNNFNGEIELLAFCLMPNHFHLLLRQRSANSIDSFLNSLCTRYTMYFNKKYHRVGTLYQGVYKAVLVESDNQLIYLSKYIHRQAVIFKPKSQPSSFPNYLRQNVSSWLNIETILSNFSKDNPQLTYERFVYESEDTSSIVKVVLDEE